MNIFVGCLVASAFLQGFGSVLAKGLVNGVFGAEYAGLSPVAFLVVQLLGSLTILTSIALLTRVPLPRPGQFRRLLLPGAAMGLAAVGTIYALALTTASEASFVFALQPILIVPIAWILLREKTSASIIVMGGIAVCGVMTIIFNATDTVTPNRWLGSTAAIVSTSMAAVFVVAMRRAVLEDHPLTSLLVVQGIAATSVTIIWGSGLLPASQPEQFSATAVGVAATVGALYYGVAFFIYIIGLGRVAAGTAGMYLNLIPVFTTAWAFALLDESLNHAQWIGAAVVIVAMTTITRLKA